MRVKDQLGFTVEVPDLPRRIISLVPSITELLSELAGKWPAPRLSERKGICFNCFSRPAYLATTTSCLVENIKSLWFREELVPQ